MLRIISEEIRETRNLTLETRRMTEETRRMADETRQMADETRHMVDELRVGNQIAREEARNAAKKADAAWELVVMTRNEVNENIAYLRLPWWKKLFGVQPS